MSSIFTAIKNALDETKIVSFNIPLSVLFIDIECLQWQDLTKNLNILTEKENSHKLNTNRNSIL